jgi:hypothetical protein
MTAPATIIGLEIEHRTSEDWLLRLPMRMGPAINPERPATAADNTATAVILTGAQAQLRLVGKRTTQTAAELLFNGVSCRVEGHEIVLEAPSEFFAGQEGVYKGEVLVKLANGFDFVSHVIELNLLKGLGWVA